MTKAFSDTERERVRAKLKKEALSCLIRYGARKTSIDELVKLTSIAKGSFYSFYPSKELLFYEIIMDSHDSMQNDIVEQVSKLPKTPTSDDIAKLLFNAYKQMDGSIALQMSVSGDIEYLMRKLPDEIVAEHHQNDDAALKLIISMIPFASTEQIPAFSAGLRAIFLTLLHKREIGVEVYDEVLYNLLKGFCKQYIPQNNG